MQPIGKAVQFLRDLDRAELAYLVSRCTYQVIEEETWFEIVARIVVLEGPSAIAEAVTSLPRGDKDRILEAILYADPAVAKRGDSPRELRTATSSGATASTEDALPALLMAEQAQAIDVATGGARIESVNDYYKARRRRILRLLEASGLEAPTQFGDLWEWYAYWRAELPSYADRREYISKRYTQLIAASLEQELRAPAAPDPTGWERVDRALTKARSALVSATAEEDFQSVGLLCREVLISAAQAVYSEARHPSTDGVKPSRTDAARMIEAFVAVELAGGSNEVIRGHAKASLKLAVELQHRRTADFRMAALCFEATSSVTEVLAILDGRRDRVPAR